MRRVKIKWLERKQFPTIYNKFYPTTVINNITFSIILTFKESIEYANLEFIREDLFKDVNLINKEFDIFDGSKLIGKGIFIDDLEKV